MSDGSWVVQPHRPIEKLTENLWRVQGNIEGMPLERVMTIAKRSDGRLVIHNAIALEDELMKQIEAFGEVAFLVVPNAFHRIDAPRFKARYPNVVVLCPRSARAKVAKVVAVDGDYAAFPSDAHVSLDHLAGCGDAEGVMTVTSEDGATLVFNDMLFNMPHLSGFQGFVFKHVTASSGGPKVSRIAKLFLMKDKAAFRAALLELAATPRLARVIVSHHEMITENAAGTLRDVAAKL